MRHLIPLSLAAVFTFSKVFADDASQKKISNLEQEKALLEEKVSRLEAELGAAKRELADNKQKERKREGELQKVFLKLGVQSPKGLIDLFAEMSELIDKREQQIKDMVDQLEANNKK